MNAWNTIKEPQEKYLKLKSGSTRIRIVSQPVSGWVAWIEDGSKKVAIRQKEEFSLPEAVDKPKFFIAVLAYNYDAEAFQLWEVSQASLYKTLIGLSKDPDWGDPSHYDIKVNKKGEGKETSYSITPLPKSKFDKRAIEEAPKINFDKWFAGDDPWELNDIPF